MLPKASLAAALAATLVPAIVQAGPLNPNSPKIFLHLTHPTTKGILCDRGLVTDCTEAVVNGDLYPNGKSYFLFVEVAKGNNMRDLAGLQFGVEYDAAAGSGVDIFGWTYCVDAHYEYPGPLGVWPAPGSSNLLVWNANDNCQTGATAIAGYFYMAAYSPDVVRIIPRPVDGKAKVGTCEAEEVLVSASGLGRVAFSSGATTPGCNPCVDDCTGLHPRGNPIKPDMTPVFETTWSGVKALFGTGS